MALLVSPCCTRRLRVQVFKNCKGWKHKLYAKCPGCRRLWTVKLTLTELGFATRAELTTIRSEHENS